MEIPKDSAITNNRTESYNDKMSWTCIGNIPKYYNLCKFHQSDREYGITKYLCRDFDETIHTVFFTVRTQNEITDYNLEIMFSDDIDHIYEIPFLDELQEELSKLHRIIEENPIEQKIYKKMSFALRHWVDYP